MLIIKRYPNRKLYDTVAKQYITLDGLAAKIREGNEIQVIDNATGEDLTTLTLTQVILDQEKKQSGKLPHTILTGLIRAGEDRLSSLPRSLRSPKGFFHQVDEEIRRRVQMLVKQGVLPEKEGSNLLDRLLSIGQPQAEAAASVGAVDQEVEHILAERNIPTRADFDQLSHQIETLTAKLDELSQDRARAGQPQGPESNRPAGKPRKPRQPRVSSQPQESGQTEAPE